MLAHNGPFINLDHLDLQVLIVVHLQVLLPSGLKWGLLGLHQSSVLQISKYEMTNNSSLEQQISVLEKKRTCNIGPKSKRLHIDNEDAMELNLTWEETQYLLRPPPSVKPSIVTIEGQVSEEYDEPPVFGKRTIFSAFSSGHVLKMFGIEVDFKKRRIVENSKSIQEHEPSGLDALASAAVLGENLVDTAELSAGATTKHPRHHAAQKDQVLQKDESDTNGASRLNTSNLEKEVGLNRSQAEVGESSAGQIDLNSHPNREDMQVDITGLNMSSHLETIANHTVREYMNHNGLRSFNNEVQNG
ncbi:B3 domain-containing transcription repressor VAL1 [Spatholobus suberectus]|nr:B3 domain-containing transcription repressor VAL1 [Spatholobus suberectus]